MPARCGSFAGIHVDVADLVDIRARIAGLAPNYLRRRNLARIGGRDMRLRGRGMEYDESRAYIAGDDFRTMDWRVMARTGDPYTKIFAEEKERRFLLAVDLSPSMYYGTRLGYKSWAAVHTAAHLGWLASFAGDRIGGLIAGPGLQHEIRPGRTRAGLLGLFHHLAAASRVEVDAGQPACRLNFRLRELRRVVRPGAIIALVSDLLGLDAESLALVSDLARQNRVEIYWIYDRSESEPWPAGRYPVLLEREKLDVEIGDSGDNRVSRCQLEHRQRIDELAARLELPLTPVNCNREITPQVLRRMVA